MDKPLQIEAEAVTVRPDDHVGADTALARHIATRIVQPHIGRIVAYGLADLLSGGGKKFFRPGLDCEGLSGPHKMRSP